LLEIGEGRTGELYSVPESMRARDRQGALSTNVSDLLRSAFGDLSTEAARSKANLIHTAILTPKNEDVDRINHLAAAAFPGVEVTYHSADTVEERDEVNHNLYPPEFLNTLQPAGLPSHDIRLKVNIRQA
jgi:ATP-dependent DNA helicase PIF1